MDNRENMNQNEENQNASGFAENIGKKLDKGLADTSEALKNNENVQKAFSAASDAGKKLDESLTNAAQNIKNSEQYHKIMQNENVQKVMQNEHIQKAGTLWNGFSKKTKYIIGAVLLLLILLLIFSGTGGNKTTILSPAYTLNEAYPTKCKAGKVSFVRMGKINTLYFVGDSANKNYYIRSEAGSADLGVGKSGDKYDIKLVGSDENDDGYIDYEIYSCPINSENYKKVCKIRCKLN